MSGRGSHPHCECGKPVDFDGIVRRACEASKLTEQETEACFEMLFSRVAYQHVASTHLVALHKLGAKSRNDLVSILFPLRAPHA